LHLFATFELKQNGDLKAPKKSTLLAAGWQGLEHRIAQTVRPVPASDILIMPGASGIAGPGVVGSIAAAVERPQTLRRLPLESFPHVVTETPKKASANTTVRAIEDAGIAGRLARIQGIVLHSLLERAASGKSGQHPDWARLTDALLRQHGLTREDFETARSAILRGLENALLHEDGRWLLMQRDSAPGQSWNETPWSMVKEGRVIGERPDRVFLGGASPGAPGTEYLWIVDYKTAPLPNGADREAFFAASRELYRNQLEAYSELFRNLPVVDEAVTTREHRLAIYHPMLPWLDWWPG
jgi:ATP-dependent helicase/nuclease subunit A